MTRFRRLRRWAGTKRVYLIAALMTVPDVMNALAGFDFTALGLSPGVSTQASAVVALGRLMLPLFADKLRRAREEQR